MSYELFNLVRQEASGNFREVVPAATPYNIAELGAIIASGNYQPTTNEFVNTLINRISLTMIRNKSFSNPLAMFKKGSQPLGTAIQDVYTNPTEAEAYELTTAAMAKLLQMSKPDTKVVYYERNRQDLYTKTIAREALQGAFVSWEKFDEFVASITNSLYASNYIDEFKYTKGLIDAAYDNDKVIVETVSAVTSESTAKELLKKMRALYTKMACPSSDYNAYSKYESGASITTWTDPERLVVILPADVAAEVDVEALAAAFNIDKANFIGRVITVDKFENEEIQGIICDEAWLQIYDNVFRFDEFYNARTMTWNEYLHAWSTFALCPFANAVVFATAQPKPATAVEFQISGTKKTSLTLEKGATSGNVLSVVKTPNDATSEVVSVVSSDERYVIATYASATGVTIDAEEVGSATVRLTLDNGVYCECVVTVTAPAEE